MFLRNPAAPVVPAAPTALAPLSGAPGASPALAPSGALLIVETPYTRTRDAQTWRLTLSWITWDAYGLCHGLSVIGPATAVQGLAAALTLGMPLTLAGDPDRVPGWQDAWNRLTLTAAPQSAWRQFRQRLPVAGSLHGTLHLLLVPDHLLPGRQDPNSPDQWAVHWGDPATQSDTEWAVLLNQPVPLDPTWQAPLLAAFTQAPDNAPRIERLTQWAFPGTPAPRLSRLTHLDLLGPAVSRAVAAGQLRVPDGQGPNPVTVPPPTAGADAYLRAWAPALGQKLERIVRPRVAAGQPAPAVYTTLPRQPYPAQADVIQALSATLDTESWAACLGEQGVGKTLMLSLVPWDLYVRRRGLAGYRVLVQCPDHLLPKWRREILETVPSAAVHVIRHWQDALACRALRHQRPDHPTYYLLGRDRGKLGFATRFAARWNTRRGGYVCPDCGAVLRDPRTGERWPREPLTKRAATRACPACHTPLWQATPKPRRMAPVEILARYAQDVFHLVITDEVHEYKGATEQGHALARLRTLAPKLLVGTGSYSTGYADDLAGLQWRCAPATMVADDLPHDEPHRVLERYGRLETVITTGAAPDDPDSTYGRRSHHRQIRTKRLPGISPLWYATKLVSHAVVLSLADLGAHALPPYTEEVAWLPLDDDQRAYHNRTLGAVRQAARAALQQGSMRLLGRLQAVGLTLPDEPWRPVSVVDRALGVVVDETPPATLTADRIYPKDARLLAEVQAALARGHRVWIYANYTGVHDQLDRAAALLENAGIRTRILAPTVDRQAREAWIAQALADDIRVCLSHPQIVETGLDLLGFPTLIWLSTGYNLMRLRQASRRAWRIGQTAPCRVLFLAYEDTLQQDALVLMGRKLEAAFALEGQLSLEGLQSLAADTSDNDLARALAYGLDGVTADAHTLWAAAAPPAFAQPPSPPLPAVFPADPVAAAPVAKPPRIPVVVIPPSPQTARRVLANQLGWDWDAAP